MKILTVVNSLSKGGTERVAQNFSEAYQDLGNDIRVLALYSGGPRKKELENKKIKVYINLDNNKTELISWGPELIHIHSGACIEDAPYLYKLTEWFTSAKFVETSVFSKVSLIEDNLSAIFQLSKWCEYLYRARGGDIRKSYIIPNPIKINTMYKPSVDDISNFKKKYGIPQNSFIMGRIGQAAEAKWSLFLIDIFEKFFNNVDKNTCLILCNPPDNIISYAYDKKYLKDNIVIIDQIIGDEELRCFYGSMDIMVHIAEGGESFGMVIAESLLCETPVLTLNTPWADNSQCEVVGNNIGGWCVNTFEEIYDKLVYLYKNKNLLKEAGLNGRKYIIEKYEMHKIAYDALCTIINNDIKSQLLKNKNGFDINSLSRSFKNNFLIKTLLRLKLIIKINFFHKVINKTLKKIIYS